MEQLLEFKYEKLGKFLIEAKKEMSKIQLMHVLKRHDNVQVLGKHIENCYKTAKAIKDDMTLFSKEIFTLKAQYEDGTCSLELYSEKLETYHLFDNKSKEFLKEYSAIYDYYSHLREPDSERAIEPNRPDQESDEPMPGGS